MAEFLDNNEMMWTNFEPKLKHRFTMEIDGIPTYLIKKVDKPSWSVPEVEISHINTTRYTFGKAKWGSETALELYNPISPSGDQLVLEWIRLCSETITGRQGYYDMVARDVTINELGPPGDIISKWTYKGAWIKSAEFGDLDYSTEADAQMINITLQYNFPILHF